MDANGSALKKKMDKRYKALKDLLMERYPKCEVCNKRNAVEVGHCLYHVHKRKFNPIYDSVENCQSNCHQCNMGHGDNANSRATKMRHWAKRESEGYNMVGWNEQVSEWRREGFE